MLKKYGKDVRVVTIGDFSKEFCGGTHLNSTGQIGLLKIINESAIAQGIRRIEAKTGIEALNYTNVLEAQINSLSKVLKSSKNELFEKLNAQINKIKFLERENASLKI